MAGEQVKPRLHSCVPAFIERILTEGPELPDIFPSRGWKLFLVDAASWLGGNMTIKDINVVSVIIMGTDTEIYPAPRRQALISRRALVLRTVLGSGRRYPHFVGDGMEAQGGWCWAG